ncbi:unnamed protein product [Urochloa humidicola]
MEESTVYKTVQLLFSTKHSNSFERKAEKQMQALSIRRMQQFFFALLQLQLSINDVSFAYKGIGVVESPNN